MSPRESRNAKHVARFPGDVVRFHYTYDISQETVTVFVATVASFAVLCAMRVVFA